MKMVEKEEATNKGNEQAKMLVDMDQNATGLFRTGMTLCPTRTCLKK
jgi:hypothetical protein